MQNARYKNQNGGRCFLVCLLSFAWFLSHCLAVPAKELPLGRELRRRVAKGQG